MEYKMLNRYLLIINLLYIVKGTNYRMSPITNVKKNITYKDQIELTNTLDTTVLTNLMRNNNKYVIKVNNKVLCYDERGFDDCNHAMHNSFEILKVKMNNTVGYTFLNDFGKVLKDDLMFGYPSYDATEVFVLTKVEKQSNRPDPKKNKNKKEGGDKKDGDAEKEENDEESSPEKENDEGEGEDKPENEDGENKKDEESKEDPETPKKEGDEPESEDADGNNKEEDSKDDAENSGDGEKDKPEKIRDAVPNVDVNSIHHDISEISTYLHKLEQQVHSKPSVMSNTVVGTKKIVFPTRKRGFVNTVPIYNGNIVAPKIYVDSNGHRFVMKQG